MTKEEFLARCANAYDAGLVAPERLVLLDRWIDSVLRFEGGQLRYWLDFLENENQRTNGFHHTLANDADGYALVQFSAILRHPCQQCATDLNAWWTRSAFCEHKKEKTADALSAL